MRFNFIFIAAFAFKAAAIVVVASVFICFVYFHYFSSVWLVVKFIRLSADSDSDGDGDRRRQQQLQRSDASEMCVLSILPKATFVSTSRRNEPNIFFEYITSPCHTAPSLHLSLYLSLLLFKMAARLPQKPSELCGKHICRLINWTMWPAQVQFQLTHLSEKPQENYREISIEWAIR